MKKQILTTVLLCFIITIGLSQEREELTINKSYELAKIYTRKNQIIKGRNLILVNDSIISFKNNSTYKEETLKINDLRSLKVKSGTKALPFALYGAGSMALASLQAWADIEADPYRETKANAGSIFAGFIAGGAVVGGLIGMATPKWKSVSIKRIKPNPTTFQLQPHIGLQNNYYALNVKVFF